MTGTALVLYDPLRAWATQHGALLLEERWQPLQSTHGRALVEAAARDSWRQR